MGLWIKSSSVTIQMKDNEQHFPVVLMIMLYKVVLTFESVDEILKCEHSSESLTSYIWWHQEVVHESSQNVKDLIIWGKKVSTKKPISFKGEVFWRWRVKSFLEMPLEQTKEFLK